MLDASFSRSFGLLLLILEFFEGDRIFPLLLLDLLPPIGRIALFTVELVEIFGDTLKFEGLNEAGVEAFLLADNDSFLHPLESDEDLRRTLTSGGTDLILS